MILSPTNFIKSSLGKNAQLKESVKSIQTYQKEYGNAARRVEIYNRNLSNLQKEVKEGRTNSSLSISSQSVLNGMRNSNNSDVQKYFSNLRNDEKATIEGYLKSKGVTITDYAKLASTTKGVKKLCAAYDEYTVKISNLKKTNADLKDKLSSGEITKGVYKNKISTNINQIKKLTAQQKEHVEATKAENVMAGEAMENAKEGTSSFKAYQQARRKLTLATIAQTAAETALNMAMTAGISAIITLGINALTSLADAMVLTKEEAAELTEEIHNKYTELNDTLKKNTQVIEDCADRYEELSKGVDSFGRNISLTNEEFNEYNSLSNEIAEQFPNLVSGYTDTGNAILSCKDNLALLNDEYDRQQRLVQDEMIKNSQNALKAYNTTYNKQSHNGWGIAARLKKQCPQ